MATTFNHLPFEVQEMILLKLPISDLLRCKSVCKGWCHIINLKRYDSVSIVKKYPYPYNHLFSGTFNCSLRYDPIETNFLVNLKSAESLAQLSQQAIFKNVKRMTTFFANLPDFDVLTDFYNRFEKLEDLTFDGMPYTSGGYAAIIVLDLKSLQKVAVYIDWFKFHFKTPNLKRLKMPWKRNRNSFFDFPESLEFLEVDHCFEGPTFPTLFTNLETFVVRQSFPIHRDDFFLQKFPALKELFISFNYHKLDQLTARLGRARTLNIYVNGINRNCFKADLLSLAKPSSSIGKKTRILIENLSLIKERNYCKFEIDYNQLEKLKSEEMEEFKRKVGSLKTISLNSGVVDQEGLLNFLKSKTPFRLKIRVSKFNESFFARLPESCQLVREIHFHAKESANLSRLDFVFKLKNLVRIDITNAFSMSFAIKLIESHESLEYLYLWLNSFRVVIASNFTENVLNVRYKTKHFKRKNFSDKQMFLDYLKAIRFELADEQIEKLFLLLPESRENY